MPFDRWVRAACEHALGAGVVAQAASGKVLTEKDIEALSAEAERGYDVKAIQRGSPSPSLERFR